jgi:PAP2 superfamily
MKKLYFFTLFCLTLSTGRAQNAYGYDSQVAQDWFNRELYLIRNGAGFTPPVASRALGYSGLALYEALVGGMPNRSSLESQLTGLTVTDPAPGVNYHWPTVANNCMATIIDSLWGNASAALKDSIHSLRDSYNAMYMSQTDYAASKALGEAVALDVYIYSMTDGGHQGYAHNTDPGYVPPVGPGLWVPTPPAFASAVQPHWGDNRPFAAASVQSPVIPTGPPTYSADTNSAFYAYAYQVYATVNNLSQAQVNIAKYWADGGGTVTPPGHSISILTQCIDIENMNLGWAAYAYAKLGMSQTDAFISCWKTKYTYNLQRPITYIRANIDSTWTSLIGTPPFPEYTSGHSTQSGAMTSVMNDLLGTAYSFTDHTNGALHGGPRSFACFDEAAYEAASSRLYGGIHYEFSDVFAITLGKMVGDNINALFETVTVGAADGDIAEQPIVRFYPNPTTNFSLISYEGFRFGKAVVYDLTGRLVLESSNPALVDLMGVPAGRYIVKVYDAKGGNVSNQQVIRL